MGTRCRCHTLGSFWLWRTGARWRIGCGRRVVAFDIAPHVRFEGQVGEQATMFFRDPSGNALEFKAFDDLGQLFAK